MINNEAKLQLLDDCKRRLQSRIQVYEFSTMKTASEYKYQVAMETAERNTSKQVSTKKTTLQNVYKYLKKIFFFNSVSTERWRRGNGMKAFSES